MGLPMAGHLSKHGEKLVIWNRTPLEEKGKDGELAKTFTGEEKIAATAPEAIRASKLTLLMLWDAASIRDLLSELKDDDFKGRTFVSHVTISPKESKEVEEIITKKGGIYVEAPVLGNSQVAQKGQLQTLVGGDKAQYDRLAPLFQSWGTPRYIGPVGTATASKLALNFNLGANLLAFASSYSYLEAMGADMNQFLAIVTNGPLALSGGYQKNWAERFQSHHYEPITFAAEGLVKDLALASEEMSSAGVHSPIAKSLAEMVKAAAEGKEKQDMTVVYDWVEPKKAKK